MAGIEYERIFPRVHSRALGGAIGVTTAVGVFLLTILQVVASPRGLQVGLLTHYFYGYDVTWIGACVGAAWAAFVGFLAGWLLGFTHNRTMDVWMFIVRQRAELSQRRDYLDPIRRDRV